MSTITEDNPTVMGDNILIYTTALCFPAWSFLRSAQRGAQTYYTMFIAKTSALSHNTFELAPVIRCRDLPLLHHQQPVGDIHGVGDTRRDDKHRRSLLLDLAQSI